MPLDQIVSGRMERRLPLVVIVRLAHVERAGAHGEERTYTDNISAHGACMLAGRWFTATSGRTTTTTSECSFKMAPSCGPLCADMTAYKISTRLDWIQ